SFAEEKLREKHNRCNSDHLVAATYTLQHLTHSVAHFHLERWFGQLLHQQKSHPLKSKHFFQPCNWQWWLWQDMLWQKKAKQEDHRKAYNLNPYWVTTKWFHCLLR